ncbi:PVC-type heme-binding CxxCH protein [Roseimaritima sediminicola]|uniref:PVC-type heme-binding CxxCH protein n=1 Tax=Roseimaritima sediminicola TaxID=2662066 RepID=UPI001F202592|nr:PVC-type heme-binding CxxCH protein [Roseimaritima sediminicola]
MLLPSSHTASFARTPHRLPLAHRLSPSMLLWTALAYLLAAATTATAAPPNAPVVAEASDEPQQALAQIRLPETWNADLFAAEPMVANIVAFDVDNRGRLFVLESFRQNKGVTDNRGHDEQWLLSDLSAKTVQDRIDYHKRLLPDEGASYTEEIDRVRRLVDEDGDGKADQVTTFAEGFNRLEEGTLAGVLARDQSVYLTCIPKVWKMLDSDDDGKVDESIVMSDGYGVRVAFRGHDLHGLVVGPDGRLYYSIGDRGYHVLTPDGRRLSNPATGAVFRCELDGSNLEVFATGMRNPQELAFNDVGDLFSGDNNSDSGDRARLIHILQGGDTGWRMYYQYLSDRGPFNRERIWEPFHQEQPAYLVPPIANFADGPSGLTYYPGTGFGSRLDDHFLLADFRGTPGNSGIRSFRLEPDGAFYKLAEDEQLIWSVLATDVQFGPDGAIWISDWVNGWNGEGKGRMYRVTDPAHAGKPIVAEVQRLLGGDWNSVDTQQLGNYLGHQDRRIRLEAQWQLAARAELPLLLDVAQDATASRLARLHAIWGADQIVRRQADGSESRTAAVQTIASLLTDDEPFVQAAAAKFVGDNAAAGKAAPEVLARLRRLLRDQHARVQYFAAMAIHDLGDADAAVEIVSLLQANDNRDPALRHAGMMALAGAVPAEQIAQLKDHPSEAVRRVAVVALRRLQHPSITQFLADQSPLVVAEAARAIHDEPIGVGLEALAELAKTPRDNDSLTRRILNANYRLGTPEAARRLAVFAERAGASETMRLEALAMLEEWAKPDLRDRVLNDVRPLPERSGDVARDALREVMPGLLRAGEAVKTKAVALAASMGLEDVVPILIQRINTKDLKPSARASALLSLSKLNAGQAAAVARQSLRSNQAALRMAALEVLAKTQPDQAAPFLRKATESESVEERQQAWDLLARSSDEFARDVIEAGIRKFLDGSLPADTQLNVLEAAEGKLDESLRSRLQAALDQRTETSPLGKWLPSLEGGSVAAGRKIFTGKTEVSCVRCHKIGGSGGDVGPDLSDVGKKRDRKYLLESLVLPDAAIAEGFETTVLADDLGNTYTGIVLKETDQTIELINPEGDKEVIDQETIVARKKGKSAMPADIVNFLSPREMRDLVAYLASLKEAPKAGPEGH